MGFLVPPFRWEYTDPVDAADMEAGTVPCPADRYVEILQARGLGPEDSTVTLKRVRPDGLPYVPQPKPSVRHTRSAPISAPR